MWKPFKCVLWFNHLWIFLDKIFSTLVYNKQAYVLTIQNNIRELYTIKAESLPSKTFFFQKISPIKQKSFIFYLALFLNVSFLIKPNVQV